MKIKILALLFLLTVGSWAVYTRLQNSNLLSNIQSNSANITKNSSVELPGAYVSPISIEYLRTKNIQTESVKIEQELPRGSNYFRYIASFKSEGYKVYGLLTIPDSDTPEGGFPAIVFNHGYIPPDQYTSTSSYIAYVDYLAREGFVVFKIDYRGNGNSEGSPSGSYFSSAYTIDALSALKSLQKLQNINPNRIGMWGHSMAGNLVLRAMLVSDQVKAGVIWAGAVYSYQDFAVYRITDHTYTRSPREESDEDPFKNREISPEVQKLRSAPEDVNFENPFWSTISLTKNIRYLSGPLQIHHAVNDSVVNIGYSRDLTEVLKTSGKKYEYFEYPGGEHNIISPYFDSAIERTVKFFKENL